MRTLLRVSIAASALLFPSALFVACGDSGTGEEDAGTETDATIQRVDAASKDAGRDTSVPDSSRPDSSRPDSSTPDASDGGGTDASDGGGTDASDGGGGDAGAGATFMVVRIGTGGAAVLSAAAAPVFVEERQSSDGAVVRTIPLPVAVAGANQPFTLAGNSSTEGMLLTSANGQYVTLAGYGAIPDTAAVNGTDAAATNRVVARIDKNAAIDTSTRLDAAFSMVSVRAAATNDGTSYWVSGENGANTSGGVYYIANGTQGGTQILAAPQNMRGLGIFGGQLYGDTQSGAAGNMLRLFTIGMGLPTAAGQTGTNLPGITSTNTSPNGFVVLDLNAAVAGIDTMYVADTRSLAAQGGVQKWTFDGATWTLATTFKTGLTGAPIHVAAAKVGSATHVVATTLDNPAKLVRFVDDGGANPTAVTLATAAANTQFRGVAVPPK